MSIMATIASLFATQKAADTALSLVERFANSGMTDKEKADFILAYQRETKHQSPARRVIAMAVTCSWLLLLLSWLVLLILGATLDSESLRMAANGIRIFMGEIVLEPFNLALMFYFGMGAVTNFKK